MQAGRGGGPAGTTNAAGAGRGRGRYMKGRLPEGVDFAAYPGRSSTPLPTAESKGAERINQLKIWNEAATNDDKRRLHAAQGKTALATAGSGSRRTDSFKDAKERHSASFQSSNPDGSGNIPDSNADPTAVDPSNPSAAVGAPSPGSGGQTAGGPGGMVAHKADMFADRSDSDSEDGGQQDDSYNNAHRNDRNPANGPPPNNALADTSTLNQKSLHNPSAVQQAAASRGPGDVEDARAGPAKPKAVAPGAPTTAGTTGPATNEAKGGCCIIQ